MNREMLFRGKREDNGEWVEGNHLYDEITDKHYIVPFGNINESQKVGQEGCCYCVGFEVIPETVGQYTGSTDKNGKQIFKGDIVKHTQQYDISGVVVSVGIVRWSNSYGAWVITDFDNGRADMFLGNEARRVEVIGNIHDNPELLEAAE